MMMHGSQFSIRPEGAFRSASGLGDKVSPRHSQGNGKERFGSAFPSREITARAVSDRNTQVILCIDPRMCVNPPALKIDAE